jgi:hypothetical protein
VIVVPATPPTLEPVRPNVPPTAFTDLELTQAPALMREGAFISTARAQVVKGKSGRWYAIFDPPASGQVIPPMILAESPHLAAIERAAEHSGAGTRLRLTGRVTVYRDRNFLLPTAPPIVERLETPPPSPTAGEAAPKAPEKLAADGTTGGTAAGGSAADPSVDRIIAELDKAAGPRRGGATLAPAPAPEPGADGGFADRSGFLASRRARVVRGGDGVPMAVVDAGAGGRTEGPFVLLPCQNLTAIESYVDALGDAASFTLTGEVHEYGGRRYLLPSMFVVNRAQTLVMPTQ